MDINKCKRKETCKLDKLLSVRINKEMLKFIKENELSATKIFHQALKELGYKKQQEGEQNGKQNI